MKKIVTEEPMERISVICKNDKGLELVYKQAQSTESIDSENAIVGWGSKPLPDRDKELIEAGAWDLDNYRKNPILCLSHDLSRPPIGKVIWVKSDPNGLKFKAKFANTERGREVYQLYKEGIMNAFSVGFRPKAGGFVENPTEEKYKGLKKVFKSVELFEISCVTIPSLPDALVECVKSGRIKDASLKEELEVLMDEKDLTPEVVKETIVEEVKSDDPTDENEEKMGMMAMEKMGMMPDGKETEQVFMKRCVADKDMKAQCKKEDITESCQMMWDKNKPAEKKDVEDEEVKTLDFATGLPSVYDILNVLGKFFDKASSNYVPSNDAPSLVEVATGSEPSRPYIYVVDVYPNAYPNGACVFRVSYRGTSKTFRQEYTYDIATKVVAFADIPVVVEEAWVAKRYADIIETKEAEEDIETKSDEKTDELDMEQNEEKDISDDIEEKAGRVLSSANQTKIEDCIDQMTDVLESLQDLLDSSNPPESNDEEDTSKEGEGKSEEDLETKEPGDDDMEIITEEKSGEDDDGFEITEKDTEVEFDFDEKVVSDIISSAVITATKNVNTAVKDKTKEEVSRVLGKAVI